MVQQHLTKVHDLFKVRTGLRPLKFEELPRTQNNYLNKKGWVKV